MGSVLDEKSHAALPLNIRRVAIVGAGPSGLAVARALQEEGVFTTIDIYEQQPEVGGTWHYTSKISHASPVPQTNPHISLDDPMLQPEADEDNTFGTPMYDSLITNIPKEIMGFHDLDFPDHVAVYPPRDEVQRYLVRYSAELRQNLILSTQVKSIFLTTNNGIDTWHLTAENVNTKEITKADYDAVLAASGHYTVPYIPSFSGMEEWIRSYPESIWHSKYYREPSKLTDKKILVVGNSASGIDLSLQIGTVSQAPVLCSVQTPSEMGFVGDIRLEVPPIQEFIVNNRAVKFEDGRIEENIDHVIFCTGYLYSFPYLDSFDPSLITNGHRVAGTYKWIFNSRHPSLAFTLLPQKMLPFFTAECQAAVIARVWSDRLRLPPLEEMEGWERTTLKEKGEGIAFHRLGYPNDGEYALMLTAWAAEAGPGGKSYPVFDDKYDYTRQIIFEAKKAFVKAGLKATSLKALGFDWREAKKSVTESTD